jgi:hypothetical protein
MHNGEFRSLKKTDDLFTVDLARALELLAIPKAERPNAFKKAQAAAGGEAVAAKAPAKKAAKKATKKAAKKAPAKRAAKKAAAK